MRPADGPHELQAKGAEQSAAEVDPRPLVIPVERRPDVAGSKPPPDNVTHEMARSGRPEGRHFTVLRRDRRVRLTVEHSPEKRPRIIIGQSVDVGGCRDGQDRSSDP